MKKFGYVAHSMLAMSLALSPVTTILASAEEDSKSTIVENAETVDTADDNVEGSVDSTEQVDDSEETKKENVSEKEDKPTVDKDVGKETSDSSEETKEDKKEEKPTKEDKPVEKPEKEKEDKVEKEKKEKPESEYDSKGYTKKDIALFKKQKVDKVAIKVDHAMTGVYIPKFTVRIGDKNGNVLGEVHASEANYKASTGQYEMVAKLSKPIKFDDTIMLDVQTGETSIKKFSFNQPNTSSFVDFEYQKASTVWTLKSNQYAKFKVLGEKWGSKDGGKLDKATLYPSVIQPIELSLDVDASDKVGLKFVTRKGNPIKNMTFAIEGEKFKTDNKGVAIVNSNKVDKKKREIELFNYFSVESKSGMINYQAYPTKDELLIDTFVVEKDDGSLDLAINDGATTGAIKTNMHTTASTDISDRWMQATVVFENSKGKKVSFDVTKDNPEISGLVEGTYKVSVKSEYAKVSARQSSVTIKNNKATTMDLDMKPKYTLEVDKDGSDYNFSVINVDGIEGKDFKGKAKTVFGVTPDEAYTVNDNSDDKVYTVPIQSDSPVTKLTLGVGVTYGGDVTAPHTAEIIVMLLVFLGIAIILGLLSLYFIRRNKVDRLVKGGMVGLLLLGTIGGTYAPFIEDVTGGKGEGSPDKVSAGGNMSNGSPGQGTPGSPPTKGVISTESDISILQVGFVDARSGKTVALGRESTINEMRDEYKFSLGKQVGMTYIAPNNKSLNIFKNSATIAMADGSGIQTILGKPDILNIDSKASYVDNGPSASMTDKRILPAATASMDHDNPYIAYMGLAVDALGSDNAKRQLWTSSGGSQHNISTTIRTMLLEEAKKHPQKYATIYDDDKEAFKDTEIFQGYLRYLKNSIGTAEAQEYGASLQAKGQARVARGEDSDVVLFVNVMIGHSRLGGDKSKVVFMTLHESAQWYLRNVKKRYPYGIYKRTNENYEEKIIEAGGTKPGTYSTDGLAKTSPTYTFSTVRKTAKKAIKPKSDKVPILRDKRGNVNTTKNPFTGWGYHRFAKKTFEDGEPLESKPLLKYEVKYKMYREIENDDTGEVTYKYDKVMTVKPGKFTSQGNGDEDAYLEKTFVSKGSTRNQNLLRNFTDTDKLQGSTKLTTKVGDSDYYLEYFPQKKTRVNIQVEDKKVTNEDTGVTKKYKNLKAYGKTYDKKDRPVNQKYHGDISAGDKWVLFQNEDIPYLKLLAYYLGEDTAVSRADTLKQQIKAVKPLMPKKFNGVDMQYANAVMKVVVPMKYVVKENKPELDVAYFVPEYKVGKYIDNIVPKGEFGKYATYVAPVSRVSDADTESLSPSGEILFGTKPVDVSEWGWLDTNPKPWGNDFVTAKLSDNINYDDPAGTIPLAGDALFKKINLDSGKPDPVMNTKLAQWKNNTTLYDNGVLPTMEETNVTDAVVVKEANNLKYYSKTPYTTWTYVWTKKELRSYTDSNGVVHSYWVTIGDRSVESSTHHDPAVYNLKVSFFHHNPDKTLKSNVFEEDVKREPKQGYRVQSGTLMGEDKKPLELKIVPEVAMIFDAQGGTSSPIYAIGDVKRPLNPTIYNTARYVFTNDDAEKALTIKPKVEGASVATDGKAKSLANRLLSNYDAETKSSEVIYRGSAVSTNFDIEGNLEFKSYVLDIGNTVAKSTWGNDSYKADEISRKYFKSFLNDKNGVWEAEFKAIGSLVVDEEPITEVKRVIKKNELDREEPIEHVLEIRGTKLISIDGDKNYDDWDTSESRSKRELLEAVEQMHLTDGGEGILSVFEENEGEIASATYVKLSNALRDVAGTKAKMRKEAKWYNEDTSLVVLREYKVKFEVPDYMYTDKVPLTVAGYTAAMDKNAFFTEGAIGHTQLKYNVGPDLEDSVPLLFNSTYDDTIGGKKSGDYIVPDVSITDTMQ